MPSKKTEQWTEEWRSKFVKEHQDKLKDFFEFSKWVHQFLDPFEKGCVREGRVIDDFGGELFIAYRSASSSPEHIERLFDRLFREEEREIIESFLIEAQKAYPQRVHDKINQALHDLTLELLYQAFEAVGRKYHVYHNDHMGTIVAEEILENGILVRKPYKGKRSPFGSKKAQFRFQLERVLKAAISNISREAITIERLVVIINKRFTRRKGEVDPLPGSWIRGPYIETHRPLTRTSLEKLFRDYGINWREEKKRIKSALQKKENRQKSQFQQNLSEKV